MIICDRQINVYRMLANGEMMQRRDGRQEQLSNYVPAKFRAKCTNPVGSMNFIMRISGVAGTLLLKLPIQEE